MNKELETIIENEFDCLINDLGCLIGEEWKAEAIKKAVTQAFVLGGVVKPLKSKYEITFEQYKKFIYKELENNFVNKETNTKMNLSDIKNKYKLRLRML